MWERLRRIGMEICWLYTALIGSAHVWAWYVGHSIEARTAGTSELVSGLGCLLGVMLAAIGGIGVRLQRMEVDRTVTTSEGGSESLLSFRVTRRYR